MTSRLSSSAHWRSSNASSVGRSIAADDQVGDLVDQHLPRAEAVAAAAARATPRGPAPSVPKAATSRTDRARSRIGRERDLRDRAGQVAPSDAGTRRPSALRERPRRSSGTCRCPPRPRGGAGAPWPLGRLRDAPLGEREERRRDRRGAGSGRDAPRLIVARSVRPRPTVHRSFSQCALGFVGRRAAHATIRRTQEARC